MNMILSTVLEEKRRIEYMLQKYASLLSTLPKGTITEKTVNGKTYYYLKYRSGKRVISEYVNKQEIDLLRQKIARRKHIETMIKSLQEEKVLADRILEGKV